MPQYRSQPTILTGMAVDQQLQIMKWRQFLATKLRSGSWCWWCLLPGDDTTGQCVEKFSFKILNIRYCQLCGSQCGDCWCKQFEWQEEDQWLMSFAGLDYVPQAEGRVPELHLPVRTPEYSENRWHRRALVVVANLAVQSGRFIIICIIVCLHLSRLWSLLITYNCSFYLGETFTAQI